MDLKSLTAAFRLGWGRATDQAEQEQKHRCEQCPARRTLIELTDPTRLVRRPGIQN